MKNILSKTIKCLFQQWSLLSRKIMRIITLFQMILFWRVNLSSSNMNTKPSSQFIIPDIQKRRRKKKCAYSRSSDFHFVCCCYRMPDDCHLWPNLYVDHCGHRAMHSIQLCYAPVLCNRPDSRDTKIWSIFGPRLALVRQASAEPLPSYLNPFMYV